MAEPGPNANKDAALGLSISNTAVRKRVAWTVGIVALISLILTPILTGFSNRLGDPSSHKPNTYSPSLHGHQAFAEYLEEVGISVRKGRFRAAALTGSPKPLLVLEPSDDADRQEVAKAQLRLTRQFGYKSLVAAPKWEGTRSFNPLQKNWVETESALGPGDVMARLNRILPETSLYKISRPLPIPTSCTGGLVKGLTLDLGTSPQLFDGNDPRYEPLVICGDGILIARHRAQDVFLISDPDLFNTRGLAKGDNAPLMYALLSGAMGASGVVFEESSHGFAIRPTLTEELTRFPLSLFTLHCALLLVASLWMGIGRFGKARPLPPRLEKGKEALIGQSAALMNEARFDQAALTGYAKAQLATLGERMAFPPGLTDYQQIMRLVQIGSSRGITADIEQAFLSALDPPAESSAALLRQARELYQITQELTHGNR